MTRKHFNSRPLYRGRPKRANRKRLVLYFNSRPLYRGRPRLIAKAFVKNISTHAPYTEGDLSVVNCDSSATFQLTPPIQRATPLTIVSPICKPYFNSRPLYRGRLNDTLSSKQNQIISTHAPYTEGDVDSCESHYGISIFQLTPPIQRATCVLPYRSPSLHISTHAPYTEGDEPMNRKLLKSLKFQLTPPIQRATEVACNAYDGNRISTHAPYTEGDSKKQAI